MPHSSSAIEAASAALPAAGPSACRAAPVTTPRFSPPSCRRACCFVPSIGGISHHWTENTADADIVTGAEVFVDAAAAVVRGMKPPLAFSSESLPRT